jgi:hypothetical protein
MSPTSGVIGEAWKLYKAHWQHLLTFSFIVYAGVAVIGAVLTILLTWLGALVAGILSIVALFWLQAALVKAVDDVADGRADLSLGETFSQAREHLTSVAVAAILAGLGIVFGLILLIVPGLVLMTWWAVIVLVSLLLIGFNIVLSLLLSPLADWLRSFVSQIVSGTVTAPFIAIVLTMLYFRLRQAKEPVADAAAPPPPPVTPA